MTDIHLKIRRFDISENPKIIEKVVQIDHNSTFNNLKECIGEDNLENKVLKIRNPEETLVPFSFLYELKEKFFYIDITNINNYIEKNSSSLLQDAYVDAVRQKVKNLEFRIAQTELLLPQLEWRRQAYMEETANGLIAKVAFLNKRFDTLKPEFQSKIPETMA